ncbi:MAG: SpoIIE family protein phosphatase [Hydrogenophilales bacterium]|nr:SpoIIE family protein phosphatase [Hydrogenophilales bacterium]
MKVLVVDDAPDNIFVLGQHLKGQGHEIVTAQNGEQAIAAYRTENPDLVIMDVMMPVMDGYEATAAIRRIDTAHWVPIVFLSAHTDDAERTKGLEAGGDDYLAKPVNLTILSNKVRALRRIADMQDQVSNYARQMQANLEQHREERLLARHLLDHIVRQDKAEQDLVNTWVSPAQHFSGDVAITARSPANELNVLLADATGHGLAAAISVLPVIESFYSMTEKGFSISSIARELNRKVKNLLPIDRFIAAVLISIDYANRTVRVWNGGSPEAVFVTDGGVVQRIWKSTHPALGILPAAEFDSNPQVYRWDEPGEIILCSDGLPEAEDSAGIPFSMTRFLSLLSRPYGTGRFKVLADAVQSHIHGAQQRDDISLLAVRCAGALDWLPMVEAMSAAHPDKPSGHSRWRFSLSLSAAEIKRLDTLPLIMNWLDQLQINPQHRGQAFLILGELFNNALDHGLLGLDSQLKQDPDGFEQYIEQREARLSQLTDATIEVDLELFFLTGSDLLRLRVRDSGPGFDHAAIIKKREAATGQLSGRGIMLVKQLCLSLVYSGKGNDVTAVYGLD